MVKTGDISWPVTGITPTGAYRSLHVNAIGLLLLRRSAWHGYQWCVRKHIIIRVTMSHLPTTQATGLHLKLFFVNNLYSCVL